MLGDSAHGSIYFEPCLPRILALKRFGVGGRIAPKSEFLSDLTHSASTNSKMARVGASSSPVPKTDLETFRRDGVADREVGWRWRKREEVLGRNWGDLSEKPLSKREGTTATELNLATALTDRSASIELMLSIVPEIHFRES